MSEGPSILGRSLGREHIKGLPAPFHTFSSSSSSTSGPPSHCKPHETAQAEGPVAHGACTPMEGHQHYPVAESYTIYSMPTKIEYQFSCESFDKVMAEHLGSIVTGGSHRTHP